MSNSAYDDLIIGDAPVLYLPLEDTDACDHSGNGLDGTLSGTTAATTLPNGDAVLDFNGTDNYVSVADADALSISTTGKLTLEAWIRPDTLQFGSEEGSGYVHWMGKGSTDNQEYVARMYSLTNTESRPNRISGYAFNLTGGLGVGSYFQDTVTAGNWIHYVLVINTVDVDGTYTTGYTKIYKNGSQRDKDSLASLSITPANGTTPFRVGTRDLSSFFEGAIGKVAVYDGELTPYQVLEHYQTMVPPVAGTATFVQSVGKASTKTAGTTMSVTVSNTVTVGNTLIVRVVADYSAGAPTIADSKGNVYTRDRTAPNSGNTIRASIFSSPITTALVAGDTITITTANVAARTAVVDEFSGLLTAAFLDKQNGASGSSTTPGTTISITTTQANELVLGFTAVEGPVDDTYTEDDLGQFSSLPREGTTSDADGTNITNNGGYKSVGEIGTYQYRPTLDPSRNWILFILSYKAL
ncbi:hypothetical protein A2368_03870 [Candidatus Collierbacteria bacterium RIFOXYB1_FULL_49_13]|uniref:LamG-like jellyroll fold domain-containing protein n=1 Tax=Candidatus Collierbacteria bacterium RIFOXYB1_FULL_49_13 TaxID=1817728 RepID=A0A1F5FJB3_9BACT|nr:MAG: hypothetical protein A2368_03870 [Candidatus Collierbacteria bacterium RIFOXYB1_FULL_49_13]